MDTNLKNLKKEVEELKQIVNAPDWSFDRILKRCPKFQKYEKFYHESLNKMYEDALKHNKNHVVKAIESIRENDPYQ